MSTNRSLPFTGDEHRDVFPVDTSYLPEYVKNMAKSELSENNEKVVYSLRLLKTMLKEQENFSWQEDDLFLLAFLRVKKFNTDRAFKLMKGFYTAVHNYDQIYYNFNCNDVIQTLKKTKIGFLPYRDSEGCVIFLYDAASWNPPEVSMNDLVRAFTSVFLLAMRCPATQVAGFKIIVNLGGVSLKQIPHISLSHLWVFAQLVQNWFPARLRSFHMLNENFIFSSVWTAFKPLLSKKIRERWHFHGKNVKKLHRYFPPNLLPADYGGELPPFDNSTTLKEVEENEEYLSYVFSFGFPKHGIKSPRKNSSGNSK